MAAGGWAAGGWLRRLAAGLDPWRAAAEAREKAETAERRLREALDVLPTGVVFLDSELRYILWNKAYGEIYRRSSDLFRVGRQLADTLRIGVERGDYPAAIGREDAWLAERLALLADPTGERHEQQIRDGRWVMIEERRTAEGGIIGLRVDITDLKAQAAALQEALARAETASRAKAEFLADMSHELRTPLNGVIGLAEVLARTPLAPEHASIVTELLASAGRLNGLVNELLETLDAGQADAEIGAEDGAAAPRGEAGARLPDRAMKVLVADDNPTNRRVAELMLAAIGAEVASVENGAEAVAAAAAERFDLILMDLKMPVMDGLSAIAEIREAEASEGRPRRSIVVLSANTAAEDVAASLAAGADGHLGKPIRPEALLAALREAAAR